MSVDLECDEEHSRVSKKMRIQSLSTILDSAPTAKNTRVSAKKVVLKFQAPPLKASTTVPTTSATTLKKSASSRKTKPTVEVLLRSNLRKCSSVRS
jgi:hypothetical protein